MKKIILGASVAILTCALIFSYTKYNKTISNNLLLTNIEAMANDGEGEYSGWLWQKAWKDCPIAGQIIVNQTCGGVSSGTYLYNTSLLAQLSSCYGVYTVVESHMGLKSYCFDGWNFCWSDDCR